MTVALITGASTGMGRATAELLHRQGWVVYGGSRNIEALSPRPPFTCLPLDVTKEADIASALERIMREHGRLDAVVNCAGWALAGAAEETSADDARRQFETNYFGLTSVCRLASPLLRAQGRGHLVNVASIAGLIPMAFQAHYCASKAALTAFTRALRLELQPFGVQVSLVEPGDFATQITASRQLVRAPETSAYPAFARTLEVIRRDETGAQGPDAVAALVSRILSRARPAPSYLVGPFIQRLAVRLRPLVPARFFDWVLTKLYRL